jgi:hypothetical protein
VSRKNCLLACVVLLTAAALSAQPFWVKKKYTAWSKGDVKNMLENSPWTGSYAFNAMVLETLQTSTPDSRARESQPWIRYDVQIHSALPIRQALVRQEQLALKYDQLPPEKRELFDQDSAKYLGAAFPETVLIHVRYSTNVQGLDRDLALHWQTRNPAELLTNVFLITPGGKRVSPSRLTVAKGGERSFDLVFPRNVDGTPLLDPPTGSLRLEFPHPRIGQVPDGRVLVEFKGSKMMLDGQPVY